MSINKLDKRIVFSPFSDTPPFSTPRSNQSSASSSPSKLQGHFISSSSNISDAQLKNEIIGSAKEILSFFENEGRVKQNLDPKNKSKKNTIKEHLNPQIIIRQIKNSGYLGFLKQEFIKLLKVLPDNEKEDYTFRFNNAVKGNARKLENQSEKIRESLGKSPFTLIKISPVKFSSPSQRGASPSAEELLSPSQSGEYTTTELLSPGKPGTSIEKRNTFRVHLIDLLSPRSEGQDNPK